MWVNQLLYKDDYNLHILLLTTFELMQLCYTGNMIYV